MIRHQQDLQNGIDLRPMVNYPNLIAGFDISFLDDLACGVIVVFDGMNIIEQVHHIDKIEIEYVPGLLAYRELGIFMKTYEKLNSDPDLFVFDGHGQIHPRRMGLATQGSFLLEKPTFGIAKNPYIGDYEPLERIFGNMINVIEHDEILGVAFISRDGSKPIFISAGNFITLNECIDITKQYCDNIQRIPLLTRIPDRCSKDILKSLGEKR